VGGREIIAGEGEILPKVSAKLWENFANLKFHQNGKTVLNIFLPYLTGLLVLQVK